MSAPLIPCVFGRIKIIILPAKTGYFLFLTGKRLYYPVSVQRVRQGRRNASSCDITVSPVPSLTSQPKHLAQQYKEHRKEHRQRYYRVHHKHKHDKSCYLYHICNKLRNYIHKKQYTSKLSRSTLPISEPVCFVVKNDSDSFCIEAKISVLSLCITCGVILLIITP